MRSFTPLTPLKNSADVEVQYPEYYGGSYIDDNGQLVVYITGDKTKSATLSNPVLKNAESDNIVIKQARYSYNKLNDIMESINRFKLENGNNSITNNFLLYYLSDTDNEVVIELQEYNNQRIQEFKNNVLDSPAIVFKKANSKPQDIASTSVNAGAEITYTYDINKKPYTGSIGYRAKIGSKIGVVTAAHFIPLNKEIEIRYLGFAKCTKWVFSGSVDAAFCEINDFSFEPTNTLNGTSNTLSTSIAEPGVGTLVNKLGFVTGATSGYIQHNNVSTTNENGVTVTNQTSVKMLSDEGDSGGIVYSYVSASNTRYTVGVVKGKSNDGTGTITYYGKARLVNAALGCVRY